MSSNSAYGRSKRAAWAVNSGDWRNRARSPEMTAGRRQGSLSVHLAQYGHAGATTTPIRASLTDSLYDEKRAVAAHDHLSPTAFRNAFYSWRHNAHRHKTTFTTSPRGINRSMQTLHIVLFYPNFTSSAGNVSRDAIEAFKLRSSRCLMVDTGVDYRAQISHRTVKHEPHLRLQAL